MWDNHQNLNGNWSLDDITESFFVYLFNDAIAVMLKNENKVFKNSFRDFRYNYNGVWEAHGRSE